MGVVLVGGGIFKNTTLQLECQLMPEVQASIVIQALDRDRVV